MISPSLSSTSDNIEDLNEEFRMETEFKEKLSEKNEDKLNQQQLILNISETKGEKSNDKLVNAGDCLDDFDNRKLQEQLNMQIQANQQHLTAQQQLQQNQLNPTYLDQKNQTHQNQQNLNQQQQLQNQLQQIQLNPQLNAQHKINEKLQQSQQQQLQQVELNQAISDNSSKEVAKLQSPISNFDSSSFLPSWFSKQDIYNRFENGINSVLITLDPQMKEIRLAGGPSILVTSNHPFEVSSVRDAFLDVFKRATVKSKFKIKI